jgi:hypothetical protein
MMILKATSFLEDIRRTSTITRADSINFEALSEATTLTKAIF